VIPFCPEKIPFSGRMGRKGKISPLGKPSSPKVRRRERGEGILRQDVEDGGPEEE
jgi:hypothetical protein